jgi:aspartyl/glutamyl-tRNA(Asn/Gln) amidotransferase C subunit
MPATSKKITPALVKKIAFLSRISSNPSDQTLEKYAGELENIVSYIDQLTEVDTTGINATDIIATIKLDDLAEDKPYSDQEKYQRVRQNIINNFPKKQGNLLVLQTRIIN